MWQSPPLMHCSNIYNTIDFQDLNRFIFRFRLRNENLCKDELLSYNFKNILSFKIQ